MVEVFSRVTAGWVLLFSPMVWPIFYSWCAGPVKRRLWRCSGTSWFPTWKTPRELLLWMKISGSSLPGHPLAVPVHWKPGWRRSLSSREQRGVWCCDVPTPIAHCTTTISHTHLLHEPPTTAEKSPAGVGLITILNASVAVATGRGTICCAKVVEKSLYRWDSAAGWCLTVNVDETAISLLFCGQYSLPLNVRISITFPSLFQFYCVRHIGPSMVEWGQDLRHQPQQN